jgi:hypothetical protein
MEEDEVSVLSESNKEGTSESTHRSTEQSSTPLSTHMRKTLGERNPNIIVSMLTVPEKNNTVMPAKFDPSSFLETFDANATMEALTIQADQPTTPISIKKHPLAKETSRTQSLTSVSSARKHQRSHAKVLAVPTGMPGERADAAKARLEERRLARLKGKENSG